MRSGAGAKRGAAVPNLELALPAHPKLRSVWRQLHLLARRWTAQLNFAHLPSPSRSSDPVFLLSFLPPWSPALSLPPHLGEPINCSELQNADQRSPSALWRPLTLPSFFPRHSLTQLLRDLEVFHWRQPGHPDHRIAPRGFPEPQHHELCG